jgi:hypothetical protein
LLRKEKQVPQFFPLFAKKARESLNQNFEKICGYKDTSCQIKDNHFQSSEKAYLVLIMRCFRNLLL